MRNRALWALCALLALNAVLFVAAPSYALPRALSDYLLGPKMLRAEVIVMDGSVHEFRLDRGRVQRVSGATLTIYERDGTTVSVPVAGNAAITINGRAASFSALRRGMNVLTVRDGSAPAHVVTATRR